MNDSIELSRSNCGAGDDAALARAREIGERLREEFAEECEAQTIAGRLAGPSEDLIYQFDGQENAAPEAMLEHFVLELPARGLTGDRHVRPDSDWSAETVERVVARLRANVQRMRALLVEHNSYLSGGVAWVFGDTHPTVRERGISRYRFPRDGRVHLIEETDGLRIRFEAGELGPITSSGFYVPTRLAGDFSIELDYHIHEWNPGDDSACLALYVHDEPALVRYYVQRTACRADGNRHSLLANFTDAPTERREIVGERGAFRVARQGDLVRCSHRSDAHEPWLELGELRETNSGEMFTGVKVWSKVDCGGFDVRIDDWRIEASVPDEQPAPAEVREDPLSA